MKNIQISEIEMLCPSIFTVEKASHLTEKYIQTPTIKVVEDLIQLGWKISKVSEVKSKKYKGFQKHMVVFYNDNLLIKDEKGKDNVFPQIILTNSHDGKAAFNFRVGLFRLVCSNGLVISDAEFNNVSIRHTNYTFETLQTEINKIVNKIPNLIYKINLFKNKTLTEDQIKDFCIKAAQFRNNRKTLIDVDNVIKPIREEDKGDNLWVVYNRVQEKIIAGHLSFGKRKTRSIKSFKKEIELNEKIFELADSYL